MFSRSGRISGGGRYPGPPGTATKEDSVSNDVWQRIEEARDRWNVLEHPFYQRWSAGELTREELAEYSGQYRHATAAIASFRGGRRVGARGRARRAAPPRRRGGGSRRPLGRLRRRGRRRRRRGAHRRDRGVRRGLDRRGRPARPARPPLRDRERPARDLADQAGGPRRPLRDRRRARQRVLPGPREGRRPSRRRGPFADRGAPRRRRPRRARRRRRGGLQGELAAARRRHRLPPEPATTALPRNVAALRCAAMIELLARRRSRCSPGPLAAPRALSRLRRGDAPRGADRLRARRGSAPA